MITHQETNSMGNYNYNAFLYENARYSAHFHSNFELVYGVQGTTEFIISGDKITINKGECVLIAPNAVHSFCVIPDNIIWIGVFSNDFILDFAMKNQDLNYSIFFLSNEIEKFLCDNLFKQYTPSRYLLTACLNLICDECSNHEISRKNNMDTNRMFEIITYISSNYKNELTMKKVAQVFGLEYHYFSKVFHEIFSINFSEYVNIVRLNSACKFLHNPDLSITDVAEKSGFSSIRNFNRSFKSHFGISPRDYRK